MFKKHSTIRKDYNSFISASIVTAGVNFLSILLISRTYSTCGVGVLALVRLIPMIFYILLSFGVPFATIFYFSRVEDKAELVSNTLIFSTAISALLILGISVFDNILFEKVYRNIDAYTFANAVFLIPLYYFNRFTENIFRAAGENIIYSRVTIFRNLIFMFCITIVAVLSLGVSFIPLSMVLSEISILVYVLWYCIKNFGFRLSHFNLRQLIMLISFGLRSQLGNIFSYLNVRLDQFIINFILPLGSLGQYSLAVSASEVAMMPQRAIGGANLSHASNSKGNVHLKYVMKLYLKMMSITFVILLISIPVYIFSVPIVFGSEFKDSNLIYLLLLPGSLVISCNSILSSTLTGYGYPELPSWANFAALIVTISLNIFLLPRIGIMGAAIASSFAYFIQGSLTILFFLNICNRLDDLRT